MPCVSYKLTWLKSVSFQVQGVLFRVPRLPFILGSRYFTEKHELHSNGVEAEPVIHLQSVSAPQFRVFLKFLFPMCVQSSQSAEGLH
jgi:hypothetical protein